MQGVFNMVNFVVVVESNYKSWILMCGEKTGLEIPRNHYLYRSLNIYSQVHYATQWG